MRPTEPLPRQHVHQASAGLHTNKLLRLKIKQHASSSQSTSSQQMQHALDPQAAPSSSSCSSQAQAPASSLLYSTQLWQATGYSFHRQTVSRDVYFPEVLHPAPTFKQPPPADGMQGPAGQQKRAKLLNGQYRPRAAAGSSPAAAEPTHSGTAAHMQPFITPNLAAAAAMAAAAAADQQRAGSVLVSPSSSSCSHDGAGYAQQWQQQQQCQQRSSDGWNESSAPQRLRVLPVPWPLAATVKGRRSIRQRRTNIAQWQAVLQQPSPAVPAVADAAMEVEAQGPALQQQLPQLEHQQSGVSSDMQQQQQECPPLPPPASSSPLQVVLQERPLRPLQQHANTHQQQQSASPVKQRKQQPQQRKEAVALVSSALAPATPIVHAESAAGKQQQSAAENAVAAAGEGSTSSEQTHDGMNDSPRDPARGLLSSWPSSSTDSVCQLQQQLLLQQGKACAAAVQRKAAGGAAVGAPGTWASPTSPLPASAL